MAQYQKKYVDVNATTDGDNTVVAAVPERRIRVVSYVVTVAGTVPGTLQFKSGASTVLGRIRVGLEGGGAAFVGSEQEAAFETAEGASLVINNSAGLDVLGHISYIEV